jgi:hypothetical protein
MVIVVLGWQGWRVSRKVKVPALTKMTPRALALKALREPALFD